jgi:hypothetical protein
MRVGESDKVATITTAEHSEDDETDSIEPDNDSDDEDNAEVVSEQNE